MLENKPHDKVVFIKWDMEREGAQKERWLANFFWLVRTRKHITIIKEGN
jgi:hypothetical protein